jgi:hypothetical protein
MPRSIAAADSPRDGYGVDYWFWLPFVAIAVAFIVARGIWDVGFAYALIAIGVLWAIISIVSAAVVFPIVDWAFSAAFGETCQAAIHSCMATTRCQGKVALGAALVISGVLVLLGAHMKELTAGRK